MKPRAGSLFKKKVKNSFIQIIKEKYPYIILFLVSLIPFWINVSIVPSDAVLNLRDFDTPVEINHDLYINSFTWNSNWGLGLHNAAVFHLLSKNLIFSFLNLFYLPLIYIEKIYLTCILFMLGCGAYYFVSNYFSLGKENKMLCGLVGSLLYMFNIPVYTRFIGVPQILIGVALFPVILILLLKIVQSKRFTSTVKYTICLAVLYLFVLTADPSFIFLYLFVSILFVLFHIIIYRKRLDFKLVTIGFGLTIVFTFLLNLWWLTPILEGIFGSKVLMKDTLAHPHNIEVFTAANNLVSFFDNIRLHWTKKSFSLLAPDGTPYFSPAYIEHYYNSSFSYLLFLIFLGTSIGISFKNKNNKMQVIIVTLVGLICTFFSLGTQFPVFGRIHEFLFYNIPGFQSLRNFYKFQYSILIWYISLIVLLCDYLFYKYGTSKKNVAVILSCVIGFIILNALPFTAKDLAGRHEFFKVPDYYKKARLWLGSQRDDMYRILIIPQGSWEETYEWGPKFELVPIHRNFFKDSILLLQEPDNTNRLIKPIEEFKVKYLGDYLKLLNVGYILIRRDIYNPNLTIENEYLIRELPKELKIQGIILDKSFGKLDFYKVPDEYFLPHIYSSPGITIVTEDINSLLTINQTTYLNEAPALAFTEQNDRNTLLSRVGNQILFANSNLNDLVIDLAKAESQDNGGQSILSRKKPMVAKLDKKGKKRFKVEGEGIYDVYIQSPRLEEVQNLDLEIEVDGEALEDWKWKEERNRWVRAGEVNLNKGKREITITNQQLPFGSVEEKLKKLIPGIEIVIISKENVEEYKNVIIKRPTDYLFYIDKEKVEDMLNDEGKLENIKLESNNPFKIEKQQFYVPENGNYSIRTLVNPKRDFLVSDFVSSSMNSSIKVSLDVFSDWNIKALNTTYKQDISDDGICIDAYFQDGGDVKEGVVLTKKFPDISIKQRPYLFFSSEIEDSGVQEVEINVKLTDTGNKFFLFKTKNIGLKIDNKQYVINLYHKAKDIFGKKTASSLSINEITLKFKKRDGVDLSQEKDRHVYPFKFKAITFSNTPPIWTDFKDSLFAYSPDKYYYFDRNGEIKNVDFLEQIPWYIKDVYKLHIQRFIDLKENPVLFLNFPKPVIGNIVYGERRNFPTEWKVVMGLDFDRDEKEDDKIELFVPAAGVSDDRLLLNIKAHEEVKNRFSDKGVYNLLSIHVSHPDDKTIFYQTVMSKELIRYRERIYKPSDFRVGASVLDVDGKTYELPPSAIGNSDNWINYSNIFLKEGNHSLNVFENDEFKVEMVEINPVSGQQSAVNSHETPKIEFKKINPTRYIVNVKEAKGPFTLVFSESFHEGWKGYVRQAQGLRARDKGGEPLSALWSLWEDKGKRIEIKDHFVVNGYANGWIVPVEQFGVQRSRTEDKDSHNFQIVLEFKPQRLFEVGVIISATTLLGCMGYLSYDWRKKRKDRGSEN